MSNEPSDGWWQSVLTGPEGALNDWSSNETYLVLPNTKEPRIVVDKNEPRAIRDVTERLIENRTSIGPVKDIASKIAPAVLNLKRKGTWSVSSGLLGQTLREYLAEVLETDLRISVSVGPPRPNRKPVVRCYSKDGMFAVAKLGPEAHTAEMVRNEAHWLGAMAAQPLDNIVTPPLLHSGNYGESAILVMGALDLVSDLGVDFDKVPLATAGEFSSRFTQGAMLSASDWWQRLPTRMDDPELAALREELAQLANDPQFDAVETSAWHGDWSPWNMGYSPNGKLCIWDWERASVGVPTGLDVLHLHYQYGDGLDAATADLEGMGVPVENHNIVKRLYLYELCARHCEALALDTERHTKVVRALAELSRIESS